MKYWIGFIALTLGLLGCSQHNDTKIQTPLLQAQPQIMELPLYQELLPKQAQPLEFYPLSQSEMKELSLEKPETDEELLNCFEIHPGKEKTIVIYLYKHKDHLVYGYLQDGETWYGLGRVSDEGWGSASPSQWRGGTAPEFEVNGSFGVNIFYYLEDKQKWVKDNDFQEHPIYKVDLDGDQNYELIDTLGTQDPYVALYRWNKEQNHFEMAQMGQTAIQFFTSTSEQSPQFCFLFQEEEKWYIQSGNGDVYSFFEYYHGSISPVKLSDTRNRLKENLRY